MTHKTSYYDILNLSPKASDEDVKHAYRALAKKFHPDHNPHNRPLAQQRFQLINEAYANLKTREKRAVYNHALRLRTQNDNAGQSGFFAQMSEMFRPKEKEVQN